jgi:hypothetical protein
MDSRAGEQPTNPLYLIRFLLFRPQSVRFVARKVWERFNDGNGQYHAAENVAWLNDRRIETAAIANRLGSGLWDEACRFGDRLRDRAIPILYGVPVDMGGGGDYHLIYWLTGYLRPRVVFEPYVAAGWSFEAFVAARCANDE